MYNAEPFRDFFHCKISICNIYYLATVYSLHTHLEPFHDLDHGGLAPKREEGFIKEILSTFRLCCNYFPFAIRISLSPEMAFLTNFYRKEYLKYILVTIVAQNPYQSFDDCMCVGAFHCILTSHIYT